MTTNMIKHAAMEAASKAVGTMDSKRWIEVTAIIEAAIEKALKATEGTASEEFWRGYKFRKVEERFGECDETRAAQEACTCNKENRVAAQHSSHCLAAQESEP